MIAMTILGVVELMAGGTVVLAHESGGPLMDIVTTDPQSERTGYLASDIGMYMCNYCTLVRTHAQAVVLRPMVYGVPYCSMI